MLTIFKYSVPMPLQDRFSLELPKWAEVLSIQVQHGWPQIYVMAEPSQPPETRNFLLVGTGQPIMFEGCRGAIRFNYIGTFQLEDGNFVRHLIEFFEKASAERS